MKNPEIHEIIWELNSEIAERVGVENLPFEEHSNGLTTVVEFAGNMIWNDDEDERAFDEAANEYEPLKPYLLKRAQNHVAELASFFSDACELRNIATQAVKHRGHVAGEVALDKLAAILANIATQPTAPHGSSKGEAS